ncbi:MAG: hypothetical protein SOR93_09645 [Clostridiales Family XIII bacterium]|nr:hypothetical protein [Clostridia bacterium]MDY3011497.1 hypothetical protein [Clostridiales Family XIII bacterium]
MKELKVIPGGAKEKRSYKPTRLQYLEVQQRAMEECAAQYKGVAIRDVAREFPECFRQMIYAGVKQLGMIKDKELDASDELVYHTYAQMSFLLDMFDVMSPRQVIQLFPIEKTYDGARWEWKDYYYTMEAVNKTGIDNVIGAERSPEFLMDYQNWDINHFMVTFMLVVSRMRVLQGGMDIMEEWLEKQGVPTYSYYEDKGIMVNRQTGEVAKVEKPKTRVPKYMKVVKGGKEQ